MKQSQNWWESLSPQMQEYLKKQPVWHDSDMWRAGLTGAAIGFVIGVVVGFEWAWRPVVENFRPLIG